MTHRISVRDSDQKNNSHHAKLFSFHRNKKTFIAVDVPVLLVPGDGEDGLSGLLHVALLGVCSTLKINSQLVQFK